MTTRARTRAVAGVMAGAINRAVQCNYVHDVIIIDVMLGFFVAFLCYWWGAIVPISL